MENLSSVFTRIKALRLGQNITFAEMAAACGVSPAEYERIETSAPDVPLGFIMKCADRLGTDLASIVTGDDPRLSSFTLSRKGEGMPISRREGFEYSHLAYLLKDRLAEPLVVIARYSPELENAPVVLTNHGGQELNYIIDGRLKIEIDGHVMILEPGDSLYYDAHRMHGMTAIGGRDCRFLSVVVKGSAEEDIQPVKAKRAAKLKAEPANELIYRQYMSEVLDENGMLKEVSFHYPDNFNFGYDIVDELARRYPDKRAMLWVSGAGEEERTFTFADMSRDTNKAANYFRSLGIGKGDKVMLVLRRHYQYWQAVVGLHKLGAVAIPATDQLMEKDFVYRFNKAGVKAIICTGYGDAAKMAEAALPSSPT
ncbi:MAG: AMP-binding protein, partial [Defluviitaleaceae bacterium]|nr:AMP-binding protein [Defluviitaleaceae bacterium]